MDRIISRLLLALLKTPPRAYGWCRTRWSCATLAATFEATRGLTGSAEPVRRWGHEVGWVWKRAKLVARDDDPHRVERLACIRFVYAQWRLGEAIVFADELAIQWRPKVGYAWRPKGPQVESMTPGTNDQYGLAGALDPVAGTLHPWVGPRNTNGLFRDLRQTLEAAYPPAPSHRISVGVDNARIPKAKAVEEWFAKQPRVRRLLLPTYCPQAHPRARASGDGHDLCTRNHTRTRVQDVVADGVEHLDVNGPWPYKLSDIYDTPAVTAAVERIVRENPLAAVG